jgi:hypothetical protein
MKHTPSTRISLRQIPLSRIISVPSNIKQLSSDVFSGNRALVREILFKEGSRLQVLGNSVFYQCGAQCRDLDHGIRDYFQDLDRQELAAKAGRLRTVMSGIVDSTAAVRSLCIPASVQEIGASCFRGSTCLTILTFEPGSQLQVLGRSAFEDSVIETVEIPPMVTVIPESCFAHCAILSKVTFLPGSELQQIGYFAFAHAGIQSIEIPRPVETFGESVFLYCVRLSKVVFEAGCRLQCLSDRAMCRCISLTEICIPAAVESLGTFCLSHCECLKTVTFENGSQLTKLGPEALSACEKLGPAIHLPSSLKEIGKYCFASSRELQGITFEANSTLCEIRKCAFAFCSLKSFCVPSSCMKIKWSCFANNTAQIIVTFESPARICEILGFDPRSAKQSGTPFEVPDSLEVLRIYQAGDRGFVYRFGRESRLRELSGDTWGPIGFGFMRVSERFLKRIRCQIEFDE